MGIQRTEDGIGRQKQKMAVPSTQENCAVDAACQDTMRASVRRKVKAKERTVKVETTTMAKEKAKEEDTEERTQEKAEKAKERVEDHSTAHAGLVGEGISRVNAHKKAKAKEEVRQKGKFVQQKDGGQRTKVR